MKNKYKNINKYIVRCKCVFSVFLLGFCSIILKTQQVMSSPFVSTEIPVARLIATEESEIEKDPRKLTPGLKTILIEEPIIIKPAQLALAPEEQAHPATLISDEESAPASILVATTEDPIKSLLYEEPEPVEQTILYLPLDGQLENEADGNKRRSNTLLIEEPEIPESKAFLCSAPEEEEPAPCEGSVKSGH